MARPLNKKLVVALSSRTLFDLDESNRIYEEAGIDAYADYQIAREDEPLQPGPAFYLAEKFLSLNQHAPLVEIVLLSRNSPDTGLRIFNSIAHYNLNITRAAFTNGRSPYPYVAAFGADLFLSVNPEDTQRALADHYAAATIVSTAAADVYPNELRIAFDGDAVLFSDESERIYQTAGLDAFADNEKRHAKKPLPGGPFKGFLAALQNIQHQFPLEDCPIRTGLFTARSAPAHERVIRTLRAWGIRIDEAIFLGGIEKGEFLDAFHADVFFDDQKSHCESASPHVTTGHVPHGVTN